MRVLKKLWPGFSESKLGWTFLVTSFVILFAVLTVAVTALLGLPWLLGSGSANEEVALGVIFPSVTLLLSVAFASYFGKSRGVSLFEILGWKKPKRNVLWLLPLITVIYVVLMVISLSILQMFSPELAGQEQEVATTVSSIDGWRLLAMIISVGVFTPIAEETFFRGLVTSLYVRRLKIPIAILFSAVLFAVAHGQINVGIDTLIFGIALGVLAWRTKSVYPAIGLHMLKNCLALFVILS